MIQEFNEPNAFDSRVLLKKFLIFKEWKCKVYKNKYMLYHFKTLLLN